MRRMLPPLLSLQLPHLASRHVKQAACLHSDRCLRFSNLLVLLAQRHRADSKVPLSRM